MPGRGKRWVCAMSEKFPLEGIRVLDVSAVLAAPVTATLLGDFGAEIIKVEMPGSGDFTRRGAAEPGGRSLSWIQEGRNKKSVTLDLHLAEGREILSRLVSQVDVMVTNYRPPTLANWQMLPDRMLALNERLVAVYITGYGLTGPYRDRGAFDRVASAFAGLTYVSGEPDRPPVRTGYAVIDYMTAYLAAFATVTALYYRDQAGGKGQVVDLALYEAGFRASEDALLDFVVNGRVRERNGNRNRNVVPASDFVTSDNVRLALHAGTDALFEKLATVMGRSELARDERFKSHKGRVLHQEELYALIDAWVGARAAKEVVELLSQADIPVSPVMSIRDIADDVHYRERGTVTTVADFEYGDLLMPNVLPKLSATPGRIRSLGPRLGEHNYEVLGELLGFSPREVDDLRARGVV